MAGRENKRKGRRSLGFPARVLMLFAAGLLVLSYLSIFFNPAKAWVMAVFGLLYIPFLLLNIFLVLWAAARRSKTILIPFLALLPSVVLIGKYFQFSGGGGGDNGDNGGEATIVSYNVGRFTSPAKRLGITSREECADSVFHYLKTLDADIICLQEFYLKDIKEVGSYLRKHFPGYETSYYVFPSAKACFGNVILSRYHIQSKGNLDFDRSTNLAISCDCNVNGTDLRIYNCHFQSYNISLSHVVKNIREDYKAAVKTTEEKLKSSISQRPKQVEQVMSSIEDCPVESIVTGDFNDNPLSYTYHRLCRERKDSFVEAGKGIGATYAYLFPFLRIDYILYPSHYEAVSHRVDRVRYSDHYPIIAKIRI